MKITADRDGERIDVLLAQKAGISRNAATRVIEGGGLTQCGTPVRKSYKVSAGDEFEYEPAKTVEVDIIPQDIPLDIVYEDSDVIVVNKPKGMVVHPAPGHSGGTLVNALLHHCKGSLSGINGELRPGIVHRIDKDTSGLIIAAKNDRAHVFLAAQLEDHSLRREYHAIVCGGFKEDSGTIDAPIGRSANDRKKMAVMQRGGRRAVTHYEVVRRYMGYVHSPGYTHIKCRLETGRTHQIRVHMAHIGRPILGDTVYGHKKPELGTDTQCLHAASLRFIHPTTGKAVELDCPLPEYFENLLTKLDEMDKINNS